MKAMSGGSSGEEKRINQGQGSVDFEATGETNESGGSSHEEKRINQGKGSVEFEAKGEPGEGSSQRREPMYKEAVCIPGKASFIESFYFDPVCTFLL